MSEEKFKENTCETCVHVSIATWVCGKCNIKYPEKFQDNCWIATNWFTALQAAREEIATLKQQLHELHEKYMNALPSD